MTLRVDVSIVPHGNESLQESICRLDISNVGLVKDLGFGHLVCKYEVKPMRYNNKTIVRLTGESEWGKLPTFFIEEHDRRDGAIELVRKACEKLESI